jgi:hypothetical protein
VPPLLLELLVEPELLPLELPLLLPEELPLLLPELLPLELPLLLPELLPVPPSVLLADDAHANQGTKAQVAKARPLAPRAR